MHVLARNPRPPRLSRRVAPPRRSRLPSIAHVFYRLFSFFLLLLQLVGQTEHLYRGVGSFTARVTAFNVLGNVTATSAPVVVQVPPTGLQLDKREYVTKQGTETRFNGKPATKSATNRSTDDVP